MAEKVGGIYYEVAYDTRPLIDGGRVIDREVNRAAQSFNIITAAVKLYAAALSALKLIELADQFRLLQARVEVAAGSMQAGAAAMAEILEISKRTQTSVEGNAQVFQRLNQSLLQMGGTQQDTLQLTELLAKAIKVSGANAVEAKAAMLQFGQALGSGKLAGDELRSLLENAPYLMRQLADGIGVPIGALKSLGEQGKLTADVVVNALSKSADKINSDFAKFPLTFDAALTGAIDAFTRLNAQFDDLSGKSAAATGIVKGAGEAFDDLATVIGKVNDESEKLTRSDQIGAWAARTREVLSYVVDAGDGVKRVFQSIGIFIGAAAAGISAMLNNTGATMPQILAQLKTIREAAFADLGRIASAPLAGQQMRDAAAADAAARRAEDRGFRPNLPGSKLKPPAGTGTGFQKLPPDYLNDGLDKLEEQLRQKYDKIADSEIEAEQRAREKVAAQQRQASDIILGADPVARLQNELEQKKALLAQYAAEDAANEQLYAQARVALEQETDQKIREVLEKRRADQAAANSAMLQNYGNLFGSLADLTAAFGGKQSAAYKALFAVSKAFAIADAIIKIQQGIANASALPFPANIGAMASVAAATASIVTTISGVQFGGGRQYGGPVDSGSLYRINETGRPEMFTASNGAQYMLPTRNGSVTAADKLGSGAVALKIEMHNTGTPQQVVSQSLDADGVLRLVTADLVDQFSSNSGPVYNALRGATNVQGRL